MSKKKSYMSLLKEAISEFDTSDNLEVKGPMLDPIISWDGGGEIPTYKDAASILERYYFNEEEDKGVNVLDEQELPASDQNDKGSASSPGMKNAKGTGTEQAGTSDSPTVLGSKEEKKEDIAKEGEEVTFEEFETALEEDEDLLEDDELLEDEDVLEGEEAIEEKEWSDKNLPRAKKYTDEHVEESDDLAMENAIIEKLIEEMEAEEDVEEKIDVMGYEGEGPEKGVLAPKEKKAKSAEEDTEGAGTEQAGTGPDEGQIPDRKDVHDKMVKPKNYSESDELLEDALSDIELDVLEELDGMLEEQDDEGAAAEEGGEESAEKLDVDAGMKEAVSAVPGGPSPKKLGEDYEEDEKYYGEAFELFKEEIEAEEKIEDIDSDDLRV